MIIHLGSSLPTTSSNQTRKPWADSPQTFPYSILLRMGFTELLTSPSKLVSSYLTLSPLPSFAKASAGMPAVVSTKEGGLLSVALSLGLPPVPVRNHPVLWSPDFPPPATKRAAIIFSSLTTLTTQFFAYTSVSTKRIRLQCGQD